MLYVSDVLNISVCPDRAHVRTILAGVFNRDTRNDVTDEISPVEAVVVLASKMLLDMQHRSGYVQAIFRFLSRWLTEDLLTDGVGILSIADNRYATLISGGFVPIYDFVEGKEMHSPPAPLLQMSINLTKLLELVQAAAVERENRSSAGDS
jgi:hypothetical protein